MLVGTRMSTDPVTVSPDTSIDVALQLMRDHKVRRLPVLDQRGRLVGVVAEKDLLYASPSPATSLSIYEIPYLLAKLTVGKVMSTEVVVVEEDTPLEEAARIMADHRVGGLPVMRGDTLVGIITETDLFKIFLELLGARDTGIRLTLRVPDVRGELAQITSAISRSGGNIISLGTFSAEDSAHAVLALKVQEIGQEALLAVMKEVKVEVVDVRET